MTVLTPETAPAAPLGELVLHRLLVAVDGSANADLALQAAITAARRDHASVTLLTVVPDVVAGASQWPSPLVAPQVGQDEVDADAAARLRETVARIPEDIPVTTVLRRGRPGPEIVR